MLGICTHWLREYSGDGPSHGCVSTNLEAVPAIALEDDSTSCCQSSIGNRFRCTSRVLPPSIFPPSPSFPPPPFSPSFPLLSLFLLSLLSVSLSSSLSLSFLSFPHPMRVMEVERMERKMGALEGAVDANQALAMGAHTVGQCLL